MIKAGLQNHQSHEGVTYICILGVREHTNELCCVQLLNKNESLYICKFKRQVKIQGKQFALILLLHTFMVKNSSANSRKVITFKVVIVLVLQGQWSFHGKKTNCQEELHNLTQTLANS